MSNKAHWPTNADKDEGGGRASDTSRTDNYADTQGHHGDPLRDRITGEREGNSGSGQ